MGIQILSIAKRSSEQFIFEDFLSEDDILLLVKSGKFSFSSSAEKTHTAESNQAVLFRKNVLYHRKALQPICIYLFRFHSDVPIFQEDHIIFSNIARIASSMYMEEQLSSQMPHNENEYCIHLFYDAIYQYTMEQQLYCGKIGKTDPLIEKAIQIMHNNLTEKVSLHTLGETIGLSYIQFLRRFRAYAGTTPSAFLEALRLKKAKELLINTDSPIKEIASECGYENAYYFSNAFKKQTGLSPSHFRNWLV